MKDKLGRRIDYLRISVTDRCNLRCLYCMPAEGVAYKSHGDILSYEEIVRFAHAGAQLGIRRIRLTGGEPLVRAGLLELVRGLKAIPGIGELSLTSNGILLAPLAGRLKAAGLDRVNISLDTLDSQKYAQISRRDSLPAAWAGIRAALEVGLEPVKINTVALRGINEDELPALAALTLKHPLHVRFIEVMPLGDDLDWARQHLLPLNEVKDLIGTVGELAPARVAGSGPAHVYRFAGGLGTVGFIAALSHNFCHLCNRLRLTADGKLKPCLASDVEVDVKGALRAGADMGEIQALYRKAVALKPSRHKLQQYREQGRNMNQIGG
ncbi:MAG: GTP 3',8-cyclase MoaA [Firmicutes bacterium]|nr:GTP 3',8-cyclase MoaA [Bacillota bacterium]